MGSNPIWSSDFTCITLLFLKNFTGKSKEGSWAFYFFLEKMSFLNPALALLTNLSNSNLPMVINEKVLTFEPVVRHKMK